jgi:hypothetical protein
MQATPCDPLILIIARRICRGSDRAACRQAGWTWHVVMTNFALAGGPVPDRISRWPNRNLIETGMQAVTDPASSGMDTTGPLSAGPSQPAQLALAMAVRRRRHAGGQSANITTERTENGKKACGGARFVIFVGSVALW